MPPTGSAPSYLNSCIQLVRALLSTKTGHQVGRWRSQWPTANLSVCKMSWMYAVVRPLSWHGFLPVGRAKLHRSSLRTPLRMGERHKFRNLLAPSELVWIMAKSSISFRRLDSQPEICLSLTLPSTGRSEMAISLQSSSKATLRTW